MKKIALLMAAILLLGLVCGCGEAEVKASEGLSYSLNTEAKTATITGIGSCVDENLVIPEKIEDCTVTVIKEGAFKGNSQITSLVVPKKVEKIGASAFESCPNLESVGIASGGEADLTIEEAAFYRCAKLIALELGKHTVSIGDEAFSECDLLSLTVPKSLTSVGKRVFSHNKNLSQLTLEEGLVVLGEGMFASAKKLEAVKIPNGIKVLPSELFSTCNNLNEVTLPNGLTNIETWAFMYCYALTEIEFPDTLIAIGSQAFRGCGLKGVITIPRSVSALDYSLSFNAFEGCKDITEIRLPSHLSVELLKEGVFASDSTYHKTSQYD